MITSARAKVILLSLTCLTGLRHLHLDLQRNNLGDAGAQVLLKPLAHLPRLSRLHVHL